MTRSDTYTVTHTYVYPILFIIFHQSLVEENMHRTALEVFKLWKIVFMDSNSAVMVNRAHPKR